MKIEDLKADLEKGDWIYKGICHDCSIPVTVEAKVAEDGAISIGGGAVYKIKIDRENRYYFKCDSCFKKDKVLRTWQSCEIYSRVVGYLRPVQQWNNGKKAEYEMRKNFSNTKGM